MTSRTLKRDKIRTLLYCIDIQYFSIHQYLNGFYLQIIRRMLEEKWDLVVSLVVPAVTHTLGLRSERILLKRQYRQPKNNCPLHFNTLMLLTVLRKFALIFKVIVVKCYFLKNFKIVLELMDFSNLSVLNSGS